MSYTQIDKRRFTDSLITVLLLLGTRACLCQAQEPSKPDSALGELRLEGKDVERLVLRRNDGHTETLKNPEETIRLPAGEYLLQDVRLKGAYIRSRSAGSERITIRAGQQEVLKVGAPLVPTLKVQRQGRILRLSYELLGVGGEAYTNGDRSKPPTFAVYRGQRKIASDKFEFG
jgi:hypothetical protein